MSYQYTSELEQKEYEAFLKRYRESEISEKIIRGNNVQTLDLNREHLLRLRRPDGKELSIRLGRRDIKLGTLVFTTPDNPRISDIVTVTEVAYKRLEDLSERDLELGNFNHRQHAFFSIRRYYPDVAWEDEVTIVYFQPVDI